MYLLAIRRRGGDIARALLAVIAILVALPALAGEVLVDYLDAGQGDAILVRGGGKAVLIDASIGKAETASQLRQLGVRRLDLVVATHPHADHIGGMPDVLRTLDVGLYMDNGQPHTTALYDTVMTVVEEREIPYRTARAGMKLNLGDEASFEVLFPDASPLKGTRSDLNSNSVVLRLDHGDVRFLFLGDAEAPTELALTRRDIEHIDVLKVAHHGGGHSSTEALLRATTPTFAVISCGTDNRYGHPKLETLVRLETIGAIVFRTDLSGHIRAVSDGTTVELLEGTLQELGPGRAPAVIAGATQGIEVGVAAESPGAATDQVATAPANDGPDLSGVQAPTRDFSDLSAGKEKKGFFLFRKKKKKERTAPATSAL